MKTKRANVIQLLNVPYQMRALIYKNRKLVKVLGEGRHIFCNVRLDRSYIMVDRRDFRLTVSDLRQVADSGLLNEEVTVVDLQDNERLLVRLDGRLNSILGPGLHVLWNGPQKLKTERVSVNGLLFRHADLEQILRLSGQEQFLESWEVAEGFRGALYRNGKLESVVSAGLYAAWKGKGSTKLYAIDCREKTLEISGQDIMTSDRVTLRLNINLVIRVMDVVKAVSCTADAEDAVYREAQLAVRAEVGGRSLDELLAEKQQFGEVLIKRVQGRAASLGIEICQAGLRDVILPGEMKEILNQVIMAGKQAEANGIVRREETAAMRSQMNTAKLIRDNPTLMRLRELEVLERIAEHGKLNVVLGEKGLADHITNLI